jgi:hypothetical protein
LDDQDGELIASEEKAVKVSLSDASTIALQPHTTLRLSSAGGSDPTSGEALLKEDVAPSSKQMAHSEQTLLSKQVVGRLAQGKMDVNAVRKEGVRYRFHAGPYVVHMIGSAFTLEYKPEGERLHLLAQSGTMTVQSPAGTKTITAGQSLTLSSRDEQAGASNDGNSSSQRGSKAASRAGTSAGQRAVQKAAADVANSKEKSFSDLAAKGEFKQIVAIARSQGLEQVLSTYSARDLQELAQAARYTGQLSLAEKTWRSMRARFAGYSNASNAAFFLGRLAAQRGQHATALAHFNTYLRESPGGVYAAEAWGRKLQVVQSTQGNEAARSLAKQYLAKFPQGAYAKSASELLK